MATIKPFCGIRPQESYAKQVAALPYDVMNRQEAKQMAKDNPYSFLHIDRAEIDLPDTVAPYDPQVYQKAAATLHQFLSDGVLIQEEAPCFYIYQLIRNGKSQTGLVVCTSVDEYLNGVIKRHELTREEKEQDRIRHVDTLNANTGPIFLAYPGQQAITDAILEYKQTHPACYDFISEDGIQHTVWKISDAETISFFIRQFQNVPSLYIADGHHRNASAVKVALKRRAEHPNYTGEEEFNYYLSVLFPAEELTILDYNRLVADLNHHTKASFLKALEKEFDVTVCPKGIPFSPPERHQFGMYLDGDWYCLKAKNVDPTDPIRSLDVSILQETVLEPILGIQDVKTDPRIDFVGGIRGLQELQKRVDSGEMKVAFSMYPTSMQELMTVADNHLIMPPKSTWFEPKLRSGLLIHSLS